MYKVLLVLWLSLIGIAISTNDKPFAWTNDNRGGYMTPYRRKLDDDMKLLSSSSYTNAINNPHMQTQPNNLNQKDAFNDMFLRLYESSLKQGKIQPLKANLKSNEQSAKPLSFSRSFTSSQTLVNGQPMAMTQASAYQPQTAARKKDDYFQSDAYINNPKRMNNALRTQRLKLLNDKEFLSSHLELSKFIFSKNLQNIKAEQISPVETTKRPAKNKKVFKIEEEEEGNEDQSIDETPKNPRQTTAKPAQKVIEGKKKAIEKVGNKKIQIEEESVGEEMLEEETSTKKPVTRTTSKASSTTSTSTESQSELVNDKLVFIPKEMEEITENENINSQTTPIPRKQKKVKIEPIQEEPEEKITKNVKEDAKTAELERQQMMKKLNEQKHLQLHPTDNHPLRNQRKMLMEQKLNDQLLNAPTGFMTNNAQMLGIAPSISASPINNQVGNNMFQLNPFQQFQQQQQQQQQPPFQQMPQQAHMQQPQMIYDQSNYANNNFDNFLQQRKMQQLNRYGKFNKPSMKLEKDETDEEN